MRWWLRPPHHAQEMRLPLSPFAPSPRCSGLPLASVRRQGARVRGLQVRPGRRCLDHGGHPSKPSHRREPGRAADRWRNWRDGLRARHVPKRRGRRGSKRYMPRAGGSHRGPPDWREDGAASSRRDRQWAGSRSGLIEATQPGLLAYPAPSAVEQRPDCRNADRSKGRSRRRSRRR